ncbi:hypothetical protein UJ101_02613 [Flavobacteriaceae bacterium UJ101]|nr:hypothetical protein UJ101_02613 [Flavobacteriaceae bacterium UJ101]
MPTILKKEIFTFLNDLKENNHRDWMQEQKKRYQANEKELKAFYQETMNELNTFDEIEKLKVFRINRDVRFSKDKTPYNVHRSASFSRQGTHRRGGYYLRLEPGSSAMAGGFFAPESADLLRIRKEFEMDSSEIYQILEEPNFKKAFGGFSQEYKVKTAPKGFSKEDPNIELIRLKSFFVVHHFTDKEVFSKDFQELLVYHYQLLTPFFDYMSDVLTTNLNGESII